MDEQLLALLDDANLLSVQDQLANLNILSTNDLQTLTGEQIDGLELKKLQARKLKLLVQLAPDKLRELELLQSDLGLKNAPTDKDVVVKIRIRQGALVDQIGFTYRDGSTFGWGGEGGGPAEFELEEGERIVKIVCKMGGSTDGVQFFLSSGRATPWYGGRGGSGPYEFTASVEDPIVAIESEDPLAFCPRIAAAITVSGRRVLREG